MRDKLENQYDLRSSKIFFTVTFQAVAEHLFERLKTPKQIAPQRSYFEHMNDIMKKGLWAVGDGAVANALRTGTRHLWRTPLAMGAKCFFEEVLTEEVKEKNPTLTHNLGIMTMATLDSIFLTPLERIKTIQQTQAGKSTDFYTLSRTLSRKELYRGAEVLSCRQIQFFGISLGVQEMTRKVLGKEQLSFPEKLGSAFLSAMSYVVVSNPLDVIKTRVQKDGSIETARDIANDMYSLYQKQGLRVLVRGMSVGGLMRVLTNVVSVMANMAILDETLKEPSTKVTHVSSKSSFSSVPPQGRGA